MLELDRCFFCCLLCRCLSVRLCFYGQISLHCGRRSHFYVVRFICCYRRGDRSFIQPFPKMMTFSILTRRKNPKIEKMTENSKISSTLALYCTALSVHDKVMPLSTERVSDKEWIDLCPPLRVSEGLTDGACMGCRTWILLE